MVGKGQLIVVVDGVFFVEGGFCSNCCEIVKCIQLPGGFVCSLGKSGLIGNVIHKLHYHHIMVPIIQTTKGLH